MKLSRELITSYIHEPHWGFQIWSHLAPVASWSRLAHPSLHPQQPPTRRQQEAWCVAHIRVLQPRADGLTGQRLQEFPIHWSTHGSVDENQGWLGPTLSLWVCLNARWVSYSVTEDYGLAFHRTRTLSSAPCWNLKSQHGSGFVVLGAWAPWGCPCAAFLLFLSWARQNSNSRRPSPAGVKTLPSSGSCGSSRESTETVVAGLPTLDKVLDLQAFLVLG